jgi:hypothetical protein
MHCLLFANNIEFWYFVFYTGSIYSSSLIIHSAAIELMYDPEYNIRRWGRIISQVRPHASNMCTFSNFVHEMNTHVTPVWWKVYM